MKHNFFKFNMNKLGVWRLAHLISKFSFSHVDLNMKKNKINYQRFCHKKFLKPMNHSMKSSEVSLRLGRQANQFCPCLLWATCQSCSHRFNIRKCLPAYGKHWLSFSNLDETPLPSAIIHPLLPGYLGHLNWGHLCIVENLTNVASSTNQLTIDKHLQVALR